MVDAESVAVMWSEFADAHPDLVDEHTTHSAWHFCDNESDANELVQLVPAGTKRATAGLLSSYEAEGEPVPQVGDLSVITDWDGRAHCIIRSTSVEIVPFQAVTREFATTEGGRATVRWMHSPTSLNVRSARTCMVGGCMR